jgi:ADP-ribose pyrophosphatase YjhB (NUDIX family)
MDATTRINTAGAFVITHGLYPFVLGEITHEGQTPIIRLGGHLQGQETAWQCAEREVYEEAALRIRPLIPETTYWVDGDQSEPVLRDAHWRHKPNQAANPILVVAYRREHQTLLSLMYLAEADELPTPSKGVKGLLLLNARDVQRLCAQPMTLEEYLQSGGHAILRAEFDRSLILEPFIQLRLLARILQSS